MIALVFVTIVVMVASQPSVPVGDRDMVGFMRVLMMTSPPGRESVFERCRQQLGPNCLSEEGLNHYYDLASQPDPLPSIPAAESSVQQVPPPLLSERVRIARRLMERYMYDQKFLDEIIAIDEKTIVQGRLELLAAVYRGEMIAFEFLTGKAGTWDIQRFIVDKLSDEIRRRELDFDSMYVLWDNINIHTIPFIQSTMEGKLAQLPHPVGSPDMNPLDFYDFDVLLKEASRVMPGWKNLPIDEIIEHLTKTIEKLNNERRFQGTSKLALQWQMVLKNNGGKVTKTQSKYFPTE